MRTLVVPLNGIDIAANSLALAVILARALTATVELIHVTSSSRLTQPAGAGTQDPAAFLERARSILPADVASEIRVESGDPVEEVLDRVRRNPDSLLVVPSRGRAGLARAVLGSVSDQLVRRSPVPVIVTRECMRFPIQTLNSVLVPLDSSPLSERAIPWAKALARQTDARIALVSVMDLNRVAAYAGISQPYELEEEARDLARGYLDDMVRRLRREGIRATWEVRLGRPADEIIRAADTIAADLVVMSSHGRGGLRRWAFGSVTDDVLRGGNTPVMVVP